MITTNEYLSIAPKNPTENIFEQNHRIIRCGCYFKLLKKHRTQEKNQYTNMERNGCLELYKLKREQCEKEREIKKNNKNREQIQPIFQTSNY